MRMFCLSPADVGTETIWEDVREHFERFERSRGEISAEQVRRGAQNSDLQIWGLQDHERVHLIVVTELSETPNGIICTARVACGAAPIALQERMLDEIGKWARQIGARCLRIVGRKGWLRRFRRFKQTGVVMEWDL